MKVEMWELKCELKSANSKIRKNIPQNTRMAHSQYSFYCKWVSEWVRECFIANNCAESDCSGNGHSQYTLFEQINCGWSSDTVSSEMSLLCHVCALVPIYTHSHARFVRDSCYCCCCCPFFSFLFCILIVHELASLPILLILLTMAASIWYSLTNEGKYFLLQFYSLKPSFPIEVLKCGSCFFPSFP